MYAALAGETDWSPEQHPPWTEKEGGIWVQGGDGPSLPSVILSPGWPSSRPRAPSIRHKQAKLWKEH